MFPAVFLSAALLPQGPGAPIAERLSPELEEHLQADGPLDVAVWLRRPAGMPDLRAELDRHRALGLPAEDARRLVLRLAREHTRPRNDALAADLEGEGRSVLYVDDYTPVVVTRLDAGGVKRVAGRPDVDRVYRAFLRGFPEGGTALPNDWASPTARTDLVHRRGITGAGVKVLINDIQPVSTTNPYLPPIVQGLTGAAGAHATAVAGVLASRHPRLTGAAPGVSLYDYGFTGDIGAPMAWSWGMQQGISFGNCSWWNGSRGSIVFLDRYFDYIIRNFGVLMFKSIGNQGNGDGRTTTPGNGYNVVGSGCAIDGDTHDWDDDVMAGFSSWVNPQPGHEKPELVACGSGIDATTTFSPWTGPVGSGTSFASPVACGIAALLGQTDPALLTQPEAVRALLMAGAFHNVEGDAALSDRDGAGHVDAAASCSAAARGQLHRTTLTGGSFAGGGYHVSVPLLAGDQTRMVAAWLANVDSAYATDVLQMDLDLVVTDPLGAVVATSVSAANPFEIVQFVPPRTGAYTARLSVRRFQGQAEPFALAWATRRDAATNQVTITGNPTRGSTLAFEFFDPYHPGGQYLAALSMTGPPAATRVGPLKVLDFGFDGLTLASLGLPGFAGVLPADGRATASLTVPDLPHLAGLTLHAAMVTLDLGLPEVVEATSPVVSILIR